MGRGLHTLVFAVHTAALAAQLLQPQRGNLSGAFSYLAGFLGELSARLQRFCRNLRRPAAASEPIDHRTTGRRPLHRDRRATHPRAPIGFILHALECRRFATAQARSRRRPARVLRLPPYVASHRGGRAGQLGRRRGPIHHLLERRRWRGPEPEGMLAAVAEDAVDP